VDFMSSSDGKSQDSPAVTRRRFLRKVAMAGTLGGAGIALGSPEGAFGSISPKAGERVSFDVEGSSYIVYIDAGVVKARNGSTGVIDYAGPDAQTVLQQTINALGTGGLIILRRGTYNLARTLTLKPGVSLLGEGSDSSFQEIVTIPVTRLLWTGLVGGTIVQTDAGSPWTGSIRDLVIDGNWTALRCLILTAPNGGYFENINIYRANDLSNGTKAQGLLVTTSQTINGNAVLNTFNRVFVGWTRGIGVELSGTPPLGSQAEKPVTLNLFQNCRFAGASVSLRITQWADTNTIVGGRIEINEPNGIGVLLGDPSLTSDSGVGQNFFYGTPIDSSGTSTTGIQANFNRQYNYFYHCPFGGSWGSNKVVWTNDSKLKLVDCPSFVDNGSWSFP